MFKYLVNSFCLYIFSYLFLFSVSFLLPENFQKYGFLNNKLNLVYLVQNKAESVSNFMHEPNLGLDFIGNFHKLSQFESQIFQSSGLVHLLAISGAQVLPIVNIICFFIALILYFLFKNKMEPHRIMQILSKIKSYISFFISLFIAILFGGTGALLRVSWLNFFRRVNLLYKVKLSIFNYYSEFSETIIDKFIILLIISLLFGNVFINYSFILSAIGASCAELSSYAYMFFRKYKNNKLFFMNKIITNSFFTEISVTIITCIFVGLVLAPLTYNSIINSCLANILAIPVVTFLVVPLALLILIIPENNIVFHFLLTSLDYSLMLFKHIAFVFSEDDLLSKNSRIFSHEGLLYLNIIMLILWGLVDIIRERKIILMRFGIVQKNYNKKIY